MRYLTPLFRGACACLLGTALFAQAQTQAPTQAQTPPQTHGDALVEPAAAQKQAREIARGDPARWTQEDTTAQARLRTMQKEMGAALQEAKNACRREIGRAHV